MLARMPIRYLSHHQSSRSCKCHQAQGPTPCHLNLVPGSCRKAAQSAAHLEEFKGVAMANAHHENAAVGERTLLRMRMHLR